MVVLAPELVWLDDRFQRGVTVTADPATGRIVAVGTGVEVPATAMRLPGRALLPGFVNAHSHAFQRLIRGRTQRPPVSADGEDPDFWSWREAMYGAALTLSPDDVYHVSRFCFLEMMRTGVTAVGEFHYLHHRPDGRPYPDPNELATRVIAAAESVGLRIVLLNVCYATGGIGRPLGDRQRRFRARSVAEYLDRTEALRESVAGAPLVTVGMAPHSIRAVPRDWLPALRSWAVERDAPLHMHVSEQVAEIEATERSYGRRPVEALSDDGVLDERFTAVHATHLTDGEVAMLGDAGAHVCACPTTERDLGDGFLRALDLLEAGSSICLGTDSHTNLDFLEEMRLVEYHERLLRQRRAVMAEPAGDRRLIAPPLLRMATTAGARSLRLDAGRLEAGALADFIAIDLDHASLAGWTDTTLGAMLVLSATPDAVADAWVGGVRRMTDRSHVAERDINEAFRAVARNRAAP